MSKAEQDGENTWAEVKQNFDFDEFERENREYIDRLRLEGDEARIREEETDSEQMARNFYIDNICRLKSPEEETALYAQCEILSAKHKIRELKKQIAEQEAIISSSNVVIRNYKRVVQSNKSNKPGRPVRSAYRENIVRNFTKKWVASLMAALEVKSCGAGGGLALLVSETEERNWRRWLNGDAIPSYTTFDNLLDSKITSGKYAGKPLCDVPVSPTHDQLLTLLQFI